MNCDEKVVYCKASRERGREGEIEIKRDRLLKFSE
jgi:hypothetical protein